ncbi:MAG: HU family DNA-binding protein [Proteobacteria bacterium]|nr:HU family DNA-binding protein [Pseudomonadota bacterium]MCP4920710.1 HU family DNA-binding protein [Pseudomonadota bacterium]
MASVTKADLVNQMASAAGITKTSAEAALSAALGGVQGALSSGGKVTLVGFGTFSVSERAARTGRDPRTRQPIQIAASKGVRFKAGKSLKEAVK